MSTVLILYLIVMLIVSVLFVRRSGTEAGFYVSDRRLDTLTVSVSLAATTIGGSAVVVTWTLIDRYGVLGALPDLAGATGLVILGIFLAHRVRRLEVMTLPAILRRHYPVNLVRFLALAIVLAQLAWLALSFRTLQLVAGLSDTMLVLVAVLTWLYSFAGGQWSVSRTDLIQFAVLVGGFTLTLFHRVPVFPGFAEGMDGTILFLVLLMLGSHLVGPDVYAKVLSAASEQTARRGAWIAGILKGLFTILILLVHGAGVRLDGFNLLLFLGVASAILSSVDSIFISSSAVIQRDVLQISSGFWGPRVIGLGLLLFSLAFALSGTGIVQIMAAGYTVFLVALFFPTLSVLLSNRGSLPLALIPPAVFLGVWLLVDQHWALFAAALAGGVWYAGEIGYRTKTRPA